MQAMRTHRPRISSRQPVAPSPALSSSHPCWLWPRRDAKEQHFTQRPHMVGQARRHRRRPWLPLPSRAAAVGGLGLGQWHAEAGMGQAKIIIDMVQRQLLAQAVLVFAQRGDAPSNSGHMLADAQVHALNEGRVDLPTAGREHLLYRLEGAKHDAVAHLHQTTAAYGLDD